MKKIVTRIMIAGLLAAIIPMWASADDRRFGGGVNYWKALDDVNVRDIDDKGLSYFVSYQYRPSLVGFQLDLEMLPDLYGKNAYAPSAYVVAGTSLYAALGVGIVNRDSKWANDPFLALKAGMEMELLPSIYLDFGVSYRVEGKMDLGDALDDIDTDTLFLGVAARIGF